MPRVFISYCHRDETHRKRLETHLSGLHRQGLIECWTDRKILAGDAWGASIDDALASADLIVLLVSPEFVGSEYCYSIEMRRALERHAAGEARVVPVVVRPTDWEKTPLARLQALPRDGKAVTRWSNRDEAWLDVVKGLRAVIEQFVELAKREPEARAAPVAAERPAAPATAPRREDPPLASPQYASLPRLDGSEPFRESESTTLIAGRHTDHGRVLLKIARDLPADVAEFVLSAEYRAAVGDRCIDRGRQPSGEHWFLMRYVDAVPASKAVQPGNTLAGALLDDVMLQLLAQLAPLTTGRAAVHRDVSPSNVLLGLDNGHLVARLIDFEGGTFVDAQQTPFGAPGFTAPEQAVGRATPASDLYSLARVAYFLATGSISSGAPGELALLLARLGADTVFQDNFDGRGVLERAWERDQAERPESAAAVLAQEHDACSKMMRRHKVIGVFRLEGASIEMWPHTYALARDGSP